MVGEAKVSTHGTGHDPVLLQSAGGGGCIKAVSCEGSFEKLLL